MKALLWLVLAGPFAAVAAAPAEAPARPRIVGISHVAFRVSDPARARAFYDTLLGYATEAPRGDAALRVAVNERQYVSLRAGLDPAADRLDHVALETDDAEAMRRYLAARGVEVPASSEKTKAATRPLPFVIPRAGPSSWSSTRRTPGRAARPPANPGGRSPDASSTPASSWATSPPRTGSTARSSGSPRPGAAAGRAPSCRGPT